MTKMLRARMEDLCKVVTDGTHDSPKLQTEGVPFIKGKHISNGIIDFGNCDFITQEDHEDACRRVKPQRGDVLFSNIGSVGDTVKVNCDRQFSIKNVALFRPDKHKVDDTYFYYLVMSPEFRANVMNVRSGSAQPFISLANLRAFEVSYHEDEKDQKKIASILSTYDELIENNQRRIKILEEMARFLYREWFVHFRFPGHDKAKMVSSPLGPIPEGWEVKVIKEVLARRPAGRIYRESDVESEGTVPVIDQSASELLGFHDNEPDHLATPESPIAIFGDHTCKMQLLVEPFSIGPNVVAFGAKIDRPISYLFHIVRSLVQTQEYKRHWTLLGAKEIVLADESTAEHFATSIQPALQQVEVLRKASRVLRRTRDLLLPRVLSGQIESISQSGKAGTELAAQSTGN